MAFRVIGRIIELAAVYPSKGKVRERLLHDVPIKALAHLCVFFLRSHSDVVTTSETENGHFLCTKI